MDALALHVLDEAQVGHHGDHGGVAFQTALFLHAHGQQSNDLVTVHLLALLVAGKAAVRVAVKGDAAVEAARDDRLFEVIEVGAAHALVDVLTIRLHAQEGALGTQTGEQLLGHGSGSAVCAVDADVQAGQIAVDGLVQVVHIVLQAVVAAVHAAHLRTGLQFDARAVVINVDFDLVLHLVGQLVAGAGKNFDAVELHRVVGGRDHDAGVCIVFAHQIGHGRRGQHTQALHVGTHAAQARGQGRFQHVAGLAGVLADEDARAAAGAASQHSGSAAADLHGQLTGQISARHTAHAVGSKILTHNKIYPTFRFTPSSGPLGHLPPSGGRLLKHHLAVRLPPVGGSCHRR